MYFVYGKKAVILLVFIFSSIIYSAQESTIRSIKALQKALPVIAIQQQVLGYLNSWQEFQPLAGHTDQTQLLSVSGNSLSLRLPDKTVKIEALTDNQSEAIQTVIRCGKQNSFEAFSYDGKYKVVSGQLSKLPDNSVKIYVLKDNQWTIVQTLLDHAGVATSVAFSPNGKYLVTGSRDKTIKIYEFNKNHEWTVMQTIEDDDIPFNEVLVVIFSANGNLLVSRSRERIRIWKNQMLELTTQE
jgi:WD40 repeat protein